MFGLYLGVFTVFHFLALLFFLKRKEEKHKGLGVDKRYIQAKKKKKPDICAYVVIYTGNPHIYEAKKTGGS